MSTFIAHGSLIKSWIICWQVFADDVKTKISSLLRLILIRSLKNKSSSMGRYWNPVIRCSLKIWNCPLISAVTIDLERSADNLMCSRCSTFLGREGTHCREWSFFSRFLPYHCGFRLFRSMTSPFIYRSVIGPVPTASAIEKNYPKDAKKADYADAKSPR